MEETTVAITSSCALVNAEEPKLILCPMSHTACIASSLMDMHLMTFAISEYLGSSSIQDNLTPPKASSLPFN